MERDGRAHSVLVSGSLDARVRWLEFPHISGFLSKNREWEQGIWGGGNREYVGVYIGKRNSENREAIRNQRRPYCSGIDHTLLFFSNSLSSEVKSR